MTANTLENENKTPNCLIIVYSYHHNNTAKIANEISSVLNADVKTPDQVKIDALSNYELIGFGAGIDSGKHYKPLLDFVNSLPQTAGKECFIFSTSAVQGDSKVDKDHKTLRQMLTSKGYKILDEFSCKGFNTNSFLKYFGGMNKDRPNQTDFENARSFSKKLLEKHHSS